MRRVWRIFWTATPRRHSFLWRFLSRSWDGDIGLRTGPPPPPAACPFWRAAFYSLWRYRAFHSSSAMERIFPSLPTAVASTVSCERGRTDYTSSIPVLEHFELPAPTVPWCFSLPAVNTGSLSWHIRTPTPLHLSLDQFPLCMTTDAIPFLPTLHSALFCAFSNYICYGLTTPPPPPGDCLLLQAHLNTRRVGEHSVTPRISPYSITVAAGRATPRIARAFPRNGLPVDHAQRAAGTPRAGATALDHLCRSSFCHQSHLWYATPIAVTPHQTLALYPAPTCGVLTMYIVFVDVDVLQHAERADGTSSSNLFAPSRRRFAAFAHFLMLSPRALPCSGDARDIHLTFATIPHAAFLYGAGEDGEQHARGRGFSPGGHNHLIRSIPGAPTVERERRHSLQPPSFADLSPAWYVRCGSSHLISDTKQPYYTPAGVMPLCRTQTVYSLCLNTDWAQLIGGTSPPSI